jgi:hypothetical protein
VRLEATCGCVKVVRERVLLPQRWRNGPVESSVELASVLRPLATAIFYARRRAALSQ